MKLDYDALATLPRAIDRPRRTAPPTVGIVHFGPGAFHRAHQAAYVDRLLDKDPRWGIAAVSLRSRGTVDALARQQGLFTLAIRDAEPGYRVIGAHGAFLGTADARGTLALLAASTTRLVTTTVTEKGYCLAADGTLDLGHPDIVRDLAHPDVPPTSVIGWIVAGLATRRAAGTAPFVAMPCDNLASNGAKLHAALAAFARARDPALADWIAGEARCPATMVDAITPASDDALVADAAAALGVADAVPVHREAFAQWVIEDVGLDRDGPDLAAVGATVTRDVAGYERAKLRILNGAHSTLAYGGLLRGHTSVAEAIGDPLLARFVESMIGEEIAPSLPPVPGLDLSDYAAAVLGRFRNPAIVHRLDQIAQDGSQKLPYRLGDTLLLRRRQGAPPGRVAAALGLWLAFLIAQTRAGIAIVDPHGARLGEAAARTSPHALIERLVTGGIVLSPDLARDSTVVDAILTSTDAALTGKWDELLR